MTGNEGWRQAVAGGPSHTLLAVHVTPGAKPGEGGDRFPAGWSPWRQGRLGVRVAAPAQEGQANGAVVAAVAAFFGVPARRVRIESGALERSKSVRVEGVSREQALALLSVPLGPQGPLGPPGADFP